MERAIDWRGHEAVAIAAHEVDGWLFGDEAISQQEVGAVEVFGLAARQLDQQLERILGFAAQQERVVGLFHGRVG